MAELGTGAWWTVGTQSLVRRPYLTTLGCPAGGPLTAEPCRACAQAQTPAVPANTTGPKWKETRGISVKAKGSREGPGHPLPDETDFIPQDMGLHQEGRQAGVQRRMTGLGAEGLAAPSPPTYPEGSAVTSGWGWCQCHWCWRARAPSWMAWRVRSESWEGRRSPPGGKAPGISHRPLGVLAKERGCLDHHSGPLLLDCGTLSWA